VTLILGMSKPEGIYICVDYRVTHSVTGEILDDSSVKSLQINFPPLENGAKALLSFTGIAELPNGTPTLTWIRETLRGEAEYPDQSLTHLHNRLNRDFARLRRPLVVNILVTHGEKRFFGGLSNIRSLNPFQLLPSFGYAMQEVNQEFLFANGSGANIAFADAKMNKMKSLLGTKPRSIEDHMKLLSIVNRRVAALDPKVSPFCCVSFINANDSFSPTSRTFAEPGENPPSGRPILLAGLDLTDFMEEAMEAFKAMQDGAPTLRERTIEERNEQLKRRP